MAFQFGKLALQQYIAFCVLYRHIQHIAQISFNIGEIKLIIHRPCAFVLDIEALFYRHSRLKEKFIVLYYRYYRIAAVQVDFYFARFEHIVIHPQHGICKRKGGYAEAEKKHDQRSNADVQLLGVIHHTFPSFCVF